MELFIVKYHNFMHQSHWEARSLGALGWSATIPLKWSTALGWSTTLSCWTTLSWWKTVTRNPRRQRSWDSGQNLAHLFKANIKYQISERNEKWQIEKNVYKFLSSEICSLAITSSLAIYSHHHLAFLHYQRCRFHRLWGSSWSCCRSPPPPSSPPVVGIGLVTLLMLMVMMMAMVTSLGRVRGVEVVVGVVGVVQGRLPTYLGLIRRTTKLGKLGASTSASSLFQSF